MPVDHKYFEQRQCHIHVLNIQKSTNVLSKTMQFIFVCPLKLYSIEQIGKKMKLTGQYFQVAGRLVLVLTTSYDIKNAVIGVCGVRVRRDSVLYV